MKIRYLHLSDLYSADIGTDVSAGFKVDLVNDSILSFWEKETAPLDFIVVTGDVARTGSPEEYVYAEQFYRKLSMVTSVPPDRFYIVPGNHDVDRRRIQAWHEALYDFESQEDISKIVTDPEAISIVTRKFHNFNEFVANLNGKRRFDQQKYFFVEHLTLESEDEKVKIDLAGLNSCFFKSSDKEEENIALGIHQVNRALDLLDNDADILIALFHHPFEFFHPVDKVCEFIVKDRFDLVLTGHSNRSSDFFIKESRDAPATLIGSGTSFSPSDERNVYFNIVEIDTKDRVGRASFFKYLTRHDVWIKDTHLNPNADGGEFTFSLPLRKKSLAGSISEGSRCSAYIGAELHKSLPLRIETVSFHNVQGFDNFTLKFVDEKDRSAALILVLGDNSTGKSSFLRCLAIGICDETGASALLEDLQSNLTRRGERTARIEIRLAHSGKGTFKIVTEVENLQSGELVRKKYYLLNEDGHYEQLNERLFPWSDIFICAYGPIRVPIEKIARYETYRARDAVRPLFQYDHPMQDPETSLNRLIRASLKNGLYEEKERAEYEILGHFQALIEKLCMFDRNESIELTENGIEIVGEHGRSKLSSEGDGYKSTIGWVMDFIAWKMLADKSVKLSEMSGIVLLDEIEQHLHPKWQRHIVAKLREQFPLVQFVATTHSPLCVSGAADLDEKTYRLIRFVKNEDGKIEPVTLSPMEGMKADQVLTSEAFELSSTRNPETEKKLKRYGDLYLKDDLTSQEQEEFISLKRYLDETLPEPAESAEQRTIQNDIKRMLEELKTISKDEKKA